MDYHESLSFKKKSFSLLKKTLQTRVLVHKPPAKGILVVFGASAGSRMKRIRYERTDIIFIFIFLIGFRFVTPAPEFNRINRRLIPTSCNFFFGSPSPKNSKVKRAWPRAI